MKKLMKILFLFAFMLSVVAITDNKVMAAEVDENVDVEAELTSVETLYTSGTTTEGVIIGGESGNWHILYITFDYEIEYSYVDGTSSEISDAIISVTNVTSNKLGTCTFIHNNGISIHDQNTRYRFITVNGEYDIRIYVNLDEYGDFDFAPVPA